MSQNIVDITFTAENLQAIDAALATLETGLAQLIALTPEKRRQLNKMGDKSEAFCRQAVDVLEQNPGVTPRNFEQADLRRDLTALDVLRPRMMRISKLQQRLIDTEMALGSDLIVAAYEGYAYLKVAGKGEGLDQLRRMMGERFNHGPRSESEAPTPAE
jgi:hypothetical protein